MSDESETHSKTDINESAPSEVEANEEEAPLADDEFFDAQASFDNVDEGAGIDSGNDAIDEINRIVNSAKPSKASSKAPSIQQSSYSRAQMANESGEGPEALDFGGSQQEVGVENKPSSSSMASKAPSKAPSIQPSKTSSKADSYAPEFLQVDAEGSQREVGVENKPSSSSMASKASSKAPSIQPSKASSKAAIPNEPADPNALEYFNIDGRSSQQKVGDENAPFREEDLSWPPEGEVVESSTGDDLGSRVSAMKVQSETAKWPDWPSVKIDGSSSQMGVTNVEPESQTPTLETQASQTQAEPPLCQDGRLQQTLNPNRPLPPLDQGYLSEILDIFEEQENNQCDQVVCGSNLAAGPSGCFNSGPNSCNAKPLVPGDSIGCNPDQRIGNAIDDALMTASAIMTHLISVDDLGPYKGYENLKDFFTVRPTKSDGSAPTSRSEDGGADAGPSDNGPETGTEDESAGVVKKCQSGPFFQESTIYAGFGFADMAKDYKREDLVQKFLHWSTSMLPESIGGRFEAPVVLENCDDEDPDAPIKNASSKASSKVPSIQQSKAPSTQPSKAPSTQSFKDPSTQPSKAPSTQSFKDPSNQPSKAPSTQSFKPPSNQPSKAPSEAAMNAPSIMEPEASSPSEEIFEGEEE